MSYDVVILGGGVTGLTAAHCLAEEGASVAVLDDYPSPGGNHISRSFGEYTFDIGSIFFHQGNPIFRIFPEAVSDMRLVRSDCSRICPEGSVRKYPFDIKKELLDKPFSQKTRLVADILKHKLLSRRGRSAEAFAKYYMGEMLFKNSGLSNYIIRFYGLGLHEVSYQLAERRMGWIRSNGSLRAFSKRNLRRLVQRSNGEEVLWRQFVRPREGFSCMYEPIADSLRRSGVHLLFGAGLKEAAAAEGGFLVRAGNVDFRSKRLISTIPMKEMARLLGYPADCAPKSITMATLCVRFSGNRGFSSPVLYNFHGNGRWKRLTMHSDFYGRVDGDEYLSLEVPLLDENWSVESCLDDFLRMIAPLDIFNGDLELVGSFETECAYPLYSLESLAKSEAMLSLLQGVGIETHGRQGRFEYIPSSALAMDRVFRAFGREDRTHG